MLKPKQVFSISMVKNEIDIIESFVRYNVNVFDGIIILDNGSTDNTVKILKQLKNEGIPLFIFEDNEYNQVAKMNQQLLSVINEFKADIIVPLDLTNFIKVFDLKSEENGIKTKENPLYLDFCKNIAINYTNDKIDPIKNLLESYERLSLAYLDLKKEKVAEEDRLKSKIMDLSIEIYEFYNEKINEENKFKTNEKIINELMSSKSWKLTEPLRKFGKWIRNI